MSYTCVTLPLLLAFFLTGCGGGSSSSGSPPPPPVSDAISDDFERAALGGNWTIFNGDVAIINNSDIGVRTRTTTLLGLGIAAWSGTTFAADQFSEAVISQDVNPSADLQVFVRRRQSDGRRYGFFWQAGTSGGEWVLKLDGGAMPGIVLVTVPTAKPLPGDTIRIEVRGNSLRGFHNGQQVISATDLTLTAPGQPGVALNIARVLDSALPTPMFESWGGGSLR